MKSILALMQGLRISTDWAIATAEFPNHPEQFGNFAALQKNPAAAACQAKQPGIG